MTYDEPHFAAEIYLVETSEKIESYNIIIEKEGTPKVLPNLKNIKRLHDSSGLMPLKDTNDWANKRANELKEKGKLVEILQKGHLAS